MIVNGADTWERIWSDSGTVWQLSNSNGTAEVIYNSETGLFRVMVYARLKCGKENRTYKGIEFITERFQTRKSSARLNFAECILNITQSNIIFWRAEMAAVKVNGVEMWEDGRGGLVDVNMVKPIDRKRNDLVLNIMDKAFAERDRLKKLKAEIWSEVQEFVSDSQKDSGLKKKVGGAKGNITLTSFDGKYKVIVAVNDTIQFSEKLQIAKQLIDQCISRWSEDARPELRALVNDAFRVGKNGVVSTARILGLRRLDIKDSTWKKAMDAISESIMVANSKNYLRFYQKDEQGAYKQIALDVASL